MYQVLRSPVATITAYGCNAGGIPLQRKGLATTGTRRGVDLDHTKSFVEL